MDELDLEGGSSDERKRDRRVEWGDQSGLKGLNFISKGGFFDSGVFLEEYFRGLEGSPRRELRKKMGFSFGRDFSQIFD